MSLPKTWRDRWESRDRDGCTVTRVFCDEADNPVVYIGLSAHNNAFSSMLVNRLVPRQSLKAKEYRPYTHEELWELIQRESARPPLHGLWVKSIKTGYRQSVDSTANPGIWFTYYVHLDGRPFGVEVFE